MRVGYLLGFLPVLILSACVMSEEVKRIEEVKRFEKRREASRSTNLTGEQIFVRSCNTCHPGGKAGMGTTLDLLNEHFPDDDKLKAYIRKGKGNMPPQPPSTINDEEMDALVGYLRTLNSK